MPLLILLENWYSGLFIPFIFILGVLLAISIWAVFVYNYITILGILHAISTWIVRVLDYIPILGTLYAISTWVVCAYDYITALLPPSEEEKRRQRLRREIAKRDVELAVSKRKLATAYETAVICARQRDDQEQEHKVQMAKLARSWQQHHVGALAAYEGECRILKSQAMYYHGHLLHAEKKVRELEKRLGSAPYVCYGPRECEREDCFCRRVVGESGVVEEEWSVVDVETESEMDSELDSELEL